MLPRRVHESKTGDEALAVLRRWYGSAPDLSVVTLEHHTMVGREYVGYRFRLRPDWAPEQWHLVEQVGFCRVKDGRIHRLDLVCTGFFPVAENDGPS